MQVMVTSWLSDRNWFGIQISRPNSKCRNLYKLDYEEGVYKLYNHTSGPHEIMPDFVQQLVCK